MIKEGYTRVTEILSPFTGYGAIDPVVLANAADRGTKVHTIIEQILEGTYYDEIPEAYKGYIDSFQLYWDINKFELVLMEQRLYDDELMITGQCDVIVIDKESGMTYLLDWKTSYSVNKTWDLQGAAYEYMAAQSGHKVDKVLFIKLDKKGKAPKVIETKGTFEEFKAVKRIYEKFFKTKQLPLLFED
jgi:hypothetical protein